MRRGRRVIQALWIRLVSLRFVNIFGSPATLRHRQPRRRRQCLSLVVFIVSLALC